jgi:hypothetical protein
MHQTRSDLNWNALDALVAAPAHHAVLLENDRVRVLEARVEPGDTVPLHAHRWPGVQYFVSFSDFVRRDDRGVVIVDSRMIELPRQRPLVLWSEPMPPHTLENVGTDPIHAIVVESKETSAAACRASGSFRNGGPRDCCPWLGGDLLRHPRGLPAPRRRPILRRDVMRIDF